jgi:hypothetical protein
MKMGSKNSFISIFSEPIRSNFGRVYLILVGVTLVSWFTHSPIGLFASATFDDQLGWSNAVSILSLDWLGPFDNLTLAKGPGFSIFIALNYLSGLPIGMSIALMIFGSGLVLRNALYKLSLPFYLVESIFLITIFDPSLVPSRALRDYITAPLLIFFIASMLQSLVFVNSNLLNSSLYKPLLLGTALGFLFITREDTEWVFAVFLIFIITQVFLNVFNSQKLTVLIRFFSLYLVGTAIVIAPILGSNIINYGSSVVSDFKEKNFVSAMNAIYSVDVGPEENRISVSKEKRSAIYPVSPAFQLLKDDLESTNNPWLKPSCDLSNLTCGDYGSYWVWAFRDAVASSGFYKSASSVSAYYESVAEQIESACSEGKLECKSNLVPLGPRWSATNNSALFSAFKRAFPIVLHTTPTGPRPVSEGGRSQLEDAKRLLGNPLTSLTAGDNRIAISGWFYNQDDTWLIAECQNEGQVQIQRVQRPDLVSAFGDENSIDAGFFISVPEGESCQFKSNDIPTKIFELDQIKMNTSAGYSFAGGELYIDSSTKEFKSTVATEMHYKLYKVVYGFYGMLYPSIFVLGVFLLFTQILIGILRRDLLRNQLTIFSLLLLILLVSRILMLSIVDVLAFPAINALYLISVLPIIPIFSILSIFNFLSSWNAKK